MGDTESIDLESARLLDADTIPNANQSLNCFSCGESMNGVFCYACGNKNDNYRRSIWSLGAELFASLTAFEGRIWRSLRSLIFKPGQMAREFSDGARQKWTSPIRLYLAMSLLLFGYIAVTKTQLIAFGTKLDASSVIQAGDKDDGFSPQVFFLERKSTIQKTVSDDAVAAFETGIADIITDEPDGTDEELQQTLNTMTQNFDKFQSQLAETPLPDNAVKLRARSNRLKTRIKKWEKEIQRRRNEDSPGKQSDVEASDAEADNDVSVDIIDINGKSISLDAEGIRQAATIALRHPERFNAPIGKTLPRIMFVMMPFSMLMGAIFIRGREKAMLFDHLVHAAYIHAFSFLLLFIFMLLVQFTPIKGLLWVYTAILLIYLPLSAKRMFGRGWFKTILTSYGVGAIYTFIMMIILTILIVSGISDIVKEVAESQAR